VRPYGVIVYGSYGFTGRLIVQECRRQRLNVLLAGRDRNKLRQQGELSGYHFEVVEMNNRQRLLQVLEQAHVLIHCGGPFQHTARAMAEACLHAGTHYTDITGEYPVFEQLANYDDTARKAGITIMPGTGFDVLPSDCLALHLKNRLPSATHLQLAFATVKGGLSRGTKRTMVEGLGEGGAIRSQGKLVAEPLGHRSMRIDFGPFTRSALSIPWGDISTAWRSTGIPNIEVYTRVSSWAIFFARWLRYVNGLFRLPLVKKILRAHIDRQEAGPDAQQLAVGRSYLWGKAWNLHGQAVESRLETINAYALTAATSVLVARKILEGGVHPGYQTPAMAYGANLILEIAGSHLTDV
jgi:short subunit dehydrogenase-like uncharacterized protein